MRQTIALGLLFAATPFLFAQPVQDAALAKRVAAVDDRVKA
jgi:hypothetical protein